MHRISAREQRARCEAHKTRGTPPRGTGGTDRQPTPPTYTQKISYLVSEIRCIA